MNTDLAHKILGTSFEDSKEEIQDAFEMKCFAIKKEILMQKSFLESYLKNKSRLINQLEEAKAFLLDIKFTNISFSNEFQELGNSRLLDFFIEYERSITSIKLQLSNSLTQSEIISTLNDLNNTQKGYLAYLNNRSSEFNLLDVEEIPLKDQIDSGKIIQELKNDIKSELLKELSRVVRLLKIKQK